MAFFGLFGKKKDNRANHAFNDMDREISQDIRIQKAELQKLRMEREAELHKLKIEKEKLQLKAEIEELQSYWQEEEEETEQKNNTEDVILTAILGAIQAKNKASPQIETSPAYSMVETPIQTGLVSMSNEQLEKLWEEVPNRYKKIAKKLDDLTLQSYLKTQLPNADNDTIKRAVMLIRGV